MKNHTVYCNVTDCIYNDNSKCVSNSITIGGENAQNEIQTCCDTFSTKQGIISSIKNAMDHTGETKIKCDSVTCHYNSDRKCQLDSIKVDCTCDSCNCSSVRETYCSSFASKQ